MNPASRNSDLHDPKSPQILRVQQTDDFAFIVHHRKVIDRVLFKKVESLPGQSVRGDTHGSRRHQITE